MRRGLRIGRHSKGVFIAPIHTQGVVLLWKQILDLVVRAWILLARQNLEGQQEGGDNGKENTAFHQCRLLGISTIMMNYG